MPTATEPKFFIWLGDDWPGPYVVQTKDTHGKVIHVVVVNGASDCADALKRAEKAFPELTNSPAVKEWSVSPCPVVEADGTFFPPRPE